MLFLIYLLLLAITTSRWTPQQLATLQCEPQADSKQFLKGDDMTICIQLVPLNQKISYSLKVDTYTALKMDGIFTHVTTSLTHPKETFLVGQAHFGSKSTYPALYYNETGLQNQDKNVYAVYSLVVTMDQGKVVSAEWDNGCWGCAGSSSCLTLNDYVLPSRIYTNCRVSPICVQPNTQECDPAIYVSFMGTDRDGSYMSSASQRFSRFQSYSIGEMYKSALALKF